MPVDCRLLAAGCWLLPGVQPFPAEEIPLSLYDIPLTTLSDEPTSLASFKGKTILLVNTASQCGLTPQYSGLARLQFKYAEKGFTVIGVPCNQFGGQEP